MLWADEHRGSGEHYWEYNHIAKGKRNCERNTYVNKGHMSGDYGLLHEIYGSYGSTPSEHELEGDCHINVALGGDHNAVGGNVNTGSSHNDLVDGFVGL